MRSRIGRGCGPLNLNLRSPMYDSTPSSATRKSVCHDARRYSPSVTDLSPAASCLRMTAAISRSSTSLSAAASISPRSRLARASFSAAERNRLPTWSARNGGLVRSIDESAPHLVGHLDDHAQLRPLLLLGQDVAL